MPPVQKEFNPLINGNQAERFRKMEPGSTEQEKYSQSESGKSEYGVATENGKSDIGASGINQAVLTAPGGSAGTVSDESYKKYKQIEAVMEEDLGEIYNNLTPQEQKAFKIKGEETARSVFKLVYRQTKVKVKKIVKLIREWLKSVPGINKFFLEQEAKIKADKIVALAGESKKIEF